MKNEELDSSDEETEEGDYTVYECPGLAPTGEIEVKNPLFEDDFVPSELSKLDKNLQEAPYTPYINSDSVNIVMSSDAPNVK
jgi:hypothetical protein